jgi:hypothetical protein
LSWYDYSAEVEMRRPEGEGKMTDDKKSTDPGLSAAERKELREREAQEAIADHEQSQKSFHENRERLRRERLVREAAEGPMVAPTPELPDDTPIERVIFSPRIQNALRAANLKTVGEVRETSDETLISLPDFGKGSLSELREKLPAVNRWGPTHGQKASLIRRIFNLQLPIPRLSGRWFSALGLVKASIRNDPQRDYSGICRSDVVSHRAGDRAFDRRCRFD